MTAKNLILKGKTAFITGASRGIGAATAECLARYGANAALFSRSREDLEKLVETLSARGLQARAYVGDVTKFADISQALASAAADFGSVDILVNNAGIIDPISRLDESSPDAWAKVLDVNVLGVYNGTRAAIPHLQGRGGTVINLSSGAANSALEGWSHYCVSKAAAKKFTECADKELRSSGIRVVGLSPGTVATDMMRSIRDSQINPVSQLPWESHAQPSWAAEAIAYLCTEEALCHAGSDFSIKTDEGRSLVRAFVEANSQEC